MEYLIRKMVCGRFPYYLGKDGVWQGLRDNALPYRGIDKTKETIRVLKEFHPKEKFDWEIYIK